MVGRRQAAKAVACLVSWFWKLFNLRVRSTIALFIWMFFLSYWFQALIVGVIASGGPDASLVHFYVVIALWMLISCIFFNAVCGICVMRMDHHCPILQSCVHHHNYKFYLLYLTVPCCLGIFVAIWLRGTFWELLLVVFGGGELSFVDNAIFGAYTNALVIAVGVGWLAREHLFLARYNRSSIEQTVLESTDFQDGDKAESFPVYDSGSQLENICTTFGVGPRLPHRLAVLQRVVDGIYWLLPLNGNVPDDSINYNSRLVDPQSIALG